MENASKALIMAGSILIAIMIISLGILVFNNMGNSAKNMANMDKQEISAFNSKITPYLGENVSGSQVNALIQYIRSVDASAVSSGDAMKYVSITYPGGSISVSDSNQLTVTGSLRVETGKYYKVTETYGEYGLINQIVVK